jgi:mono/diheme cytochrome c family protein
MIMHRAIATVALAGACTLLAGSMAGAQQGDSITPAMVKLGESIFKGKAAGGLCFSCHGMDGKGVTAPDLTDGKWLHGDGSMAFLVGIITKGVPVAKQSIVIMPPFGGGQLTPDQVRSVAAYVLSIQKKR